MQPRLKPHLFEGKYGAPGGVRTPDLVLRRHTLYPSELRAHLGKYVVFAIDFTLLPAR